MCTCVRLFSPLHRAKFVSVSPHPGRFLHFLWLSLSLSWSLRECFFYIRSVDEERNLSFPFLFLFGLSLRSFVRSKRCAGEETFQRSVDFRVHSHPYSRSAAHWAPHDRGKSNSHTFWPHWRPACSACHGTQLICWPSEGLQLG